MEQTKNDSMANKIEGSGLEPTNYKNTNFFTWQIPFWMNPFSTTPKNPKRREIEKKKKQMATLCTHTQKVDVFRFGHREERI